MLEKNLEALLVTLAMLVMLAACVPPTASPVSQLPAASAVAPSALPAPAATALLPTAAATATQALPSVTPTATTGPAIAATATAVIPTTAPTQPRPSPAAAANKQPGLPPDCQPAAAPGSALYVEPGRRYCFLYPSRFVTQTNNLGQLGVELAVFGPALDKNADPVRAALMVETMPVPAGAGLSGAVDAFLKQFQGMPVPPIKRQQTVVSGGPAELLDAVPGRTGSRDIFVLNNAGERLYHLIFTPSVIGFPQAKADVEELYQMVSEHFAFLGPGPEATLAASNVTFSYPPALAQALKRATIPAEASGGDGPWWLPAPQHDEISLVGYPLTGTVGTPRVIVYPAREFAAKNAEAGRRVAALEQLLKTRPANPDGDLPFLPLINAKQELHAGVKYLSFAGGQGVRYLTRYGQGPANDSPLFYTFQGLTSDGEYYVAAILPVSPGLLPPGFGMLPQGEREALRGRLEQTLAAGGGDLQPGLAALDALVTSIKLN